MKSNGENWITTRTGDKGETSLCDGRRVPKDSLRVELNGTLDECQAHLGMARATCNYDEVCDRICFLEQSLGLLMGYIALCPDIKAPETVKLEEIVETVRKVTGESFRFIRPGDSAPGAALHAARAVARRAERVAVKLFREEELEPGAYTYINRLSDVIYALSLWMDYLNRGGNSSSCE